MVNQEQKGVAMMTEYSSLQWETVFLSGQGLRGRLFLSWEPRGQEGGVERAWLC